MTTTTHAAAATDLTIERTLDLQAAPERVWRALTDELGAWFGAPVDLAFEAGSAGWLDFGKDGRFACRVEAIEPGRYLAWRGAGEPDMPFEAGPTSLVEWRLEPSSAGGTRLTMRETGLASKRHLEGNTAGWFEELGELREHLAVEPWQVPIRRRLELRADRERVWRALSDNGELSQWWGSRTPVDVRVGWEGWFDFPEHGRHAVRIEVVEPPRYLAWRWTANEPDVPLADARQPLVVEWLLESREAGGTTLHLMESGFIGPESHGDNSGGWDGEVLPNLVRLLDGDAAPA